MDDLAGYVALALAPNIGPVRLRTLLDACGTPDGAFSAPFAFLCSLPGFSRSAATGVRSARRAEGELVRRRTAAAGGELLVPDAPAFPAALREIPDPPALLFVSGDPALLQQPAVAIVGSRDHSVYGATVCRMIAQRAARAGIVVVSGMARGLDAEAHHAALDTGGPSIGVLGNGLGVVYPAANRALYDRMRRTGCS
jgi:DNA processing protein